jgi:hypothetical protein
MNAKLAKAVRRVARVAPGFPVETQYLIHRRTGVMRVGKCLRGVMLHIKKKVKRGELPQINRYTAKGMHAARAAG